jgi:hypothetical protein
VAGHIPETIISKEEMQEALKKDSLKKRQPKKGQCKCCGKGGGRKASKVAKMLCAPYSVESVLLCAKCCKDFERMAADGGYSKVDMEKL